MFRSMAVAAVVELVALQLGSKEIRELAAAAVVVAAAEVEAEHPC